MVIRLVLLLALACADAPPVAAKPPGIKTSPIPWPGAEGRMVHGYMAIPGKARMQQPAVLVLGDATADGQAAAHRMVDAIARAGFIACTPRGDEAPADLQASLIWLRTNRYATGRTALVALGSSAASRAAALRPGGDDPALLVFGSPTPPPGATVLALPLPAPDADLPPEATTFLKEHLR